jgi:hypothetical protein
LFFFSNSTSSKNESLSTSEPVLFFRPEDATLLSTFDWLLAAAAGATGGSVVDFWALTPFFAVTFASNAFCEKKPEISSFLHFQQ